MKYLHFLLAGIILGAESRVLSPSGFLEALQFPAEESFSPPDQKLEKLLTEFAEETSVEEILDHGEDEKTQWLNQLKLMIDDISKGQDNPETTTTESLRSFQSPNTLKELIDSADEIDFYHQDGPHDGRHVKSRYEDSSAMFPLIQKELNGSEDKNGKNDANELDSMLLDFQGQINRMQKYLGKLCKKRKSTLLPVQKTSDDGQDLSISLD